MSRPQEAFIFLLNLVNSHILHFEVIEFYSIFHFFRTINIPEKRYVIKTVYRVVKRCCPGWVGDECTTGTVFLIIGNNWD